MLGLYGSCLQMATPAPEVVWNVVRQHHAFLVKRDGYQFSKEAMNPVSKHAYKWSSFPQSRAAGVVERDGKVALVKSVPQHVNKPQHRTKEVSLMKGHERAAKTINKHLYRSFYRPDLRSAALAKYAALKRTTRTRQSKGVVRSSTARRVRQENK